jgi:hypothetical protein
VRYHRTNSDILNHGSNTGIPFVISICPITAVAAGNALEALNSLDPHNVGRTIPLAAFGRC